MNSHDRDLIEKSLTGQLSKPEELQFNEKKKDPLFEKEIALQQELLSYLEAHKKTELKKELKTLFDGDKQKRKPKPQIQVRFWYGLAASIAIIAGFTATWNTQRVDHVELFGKYYDAFPAEGIIRGDTPTNFENTMYLYSNGNYGKVIETIESQIASGQIFENQMIYLGNAYINSSSLEKAITSFQSISEHNKYYNDSQWFLSLAYLKKGKLEDAKIVLRKVSKNRSIYSSSASDLLIDLE